MPRGAGSPSRRASRTSCSRPRPVPSTSASGTPAVSAVASARPRPARRAGAPAGCSARAASPRPACRRRTWRTPSRRTSRRRARRPSPTNRQEPRDARRRRSCPAPGRPLSAGARIMIVARAISATNALEQHGAVADGGSGSPCDLLRRGARADEAVEAASTPRRRSSRRGRGRSLSRPTPGAAVVTPAAAPRTRRRGPRRRPRRAPCRARTPRGTRAAGGGATPAGGTPRSSRARISVTHVVVRQEEPGGDLACPAPRTPSVAGHEDRASAATAAAQGACTTTPMTRRAAR